LAGKHVRCIDDKLIERISGRGLKAKTDKSQHLKCGCAASVDIIGEMPDARLKNKRGF
jgi:hypothetical protein